MELSCHPSRDSDIRLLETLIDAALEAGRAVQEIYQAGYDVTHKADQSPVTDADRAAEAIILRRLTQAAPAVPVVAEEEVAAGRVPCVGREFFLVDPLDGTKEFIQRRGDFTVNIALIREGSPVLGAVYAPANSKLFAGDVASQTAIRAVYVTPHHQYPTTATLSAGRRIELLELARKLRIAVIEDDYDHEYHYDGRPVLPMASADRAGVVCYVGTLAKIVAPGVRLGFVAGPRPLLESVAAHRHAVDRQGDHSLECAVAELLEHGDVQRHARRARRIYQARRDAAVTGLRSELGDAVSFTVPPGGISIWVAAAKPIDVDEWAERAQRRGFILHTARGYSYDGRPRPFFRLGFAALTEEELWGALRELRRSL